MAAPIRIIAGPTGAGKSALAMAIAEASGARIISADSQQIYRGFDIGTAKPTHADRALVHHEGIDVAEPTERWSAARWSTEAVRWLEDAARAAVPAVVVGGTGLWLRALVTPLAPEPPMDPERRADLQASLGQQDTPTLRKLVEQLDPERAHLGRTQLLRAAEVALLTGKRLSDLHRAQAAEGASARRAARWLIVDPGPALQERLERRLDAMFAAGWADEVQRLMGRVPEDAPAWNACGYREIRDGVRQGGDLSAVREVVRISTRQYAKRQRTWFRHQLNDEPAVLRLDPREPDAVEQAIRWFKEGAHA